MEFTMTASALNTMTTTAYYSNKSGCFTSFKRKSKKAFMKNIKAFVISDFYKNKILKDLYLTNENIKIVNIEKIFETTFPNETIKALRKLKIENYDVYLCLVIKSMRELLMRFRLNNNLRCQLYLLCSSVKMAQQLHISKSNISVFIPDKELEEFKELNEDIKNYHKEQDEKNELNFKKIKYSFESYEGLKKQIKKLVPELKEHKHDEPVLKEMVEDAIEGAEESKADPEDIKADIEE